MIAAEVKQFCGFASVSKVYTHCQHFDNENILASCCDAFPKEILMYIWKSENNHSRPYLGDNEIQFELIQIK